MQRLIDAIEQGGCLLDLHERELPAILDLALTHAVAKNLLPADEQSTVLAGLLEREEAMSTAIGHAVSVPHVYRSGITTSGVLFLRLDRGINLGAPDGVPVRFLIVLFGPPDGTAEHLDTLLSIAQLMSDDEFRFEAGLVRTPEQLIEALHHFEDRTVVDASKPESKFPEELTVTRRFGGGVVADLKRRLPHYLSDIREGLNLKSLAAILFLYFACLAPSVTFGGLMASLTGGEIGAIERLVGVAICGMLWAVLAGQPLIILGGTGPLLVFTGILYSLCAVWDVPFLPMYAWTGLWAAGFLAICALTDASALIRYFTRFTDEIFAALISAIFIHEASKNLLGYAAGARSRTIDHDSAFLSLILGLGTFYVALSLSRFRRSKYLGHTAREFLADFGPIIAVTSMVLVTFYFPLVALDSLSIPDRIEPSTDRGWRLPLLPDGFPPVMAFVAIGPALLLTVLMYVDQNITSRLVNSADHHLRKGPAYHWDLLVVSGLMAGCSLFGFPWFVAATVRSLNHVRSLAQTETVVSTGTDAREKIIHVHENRVTGFCVHAMIGLTLLLLSYLPPIPMSVLYGLFLYMGVVSLAGNQFFERLSLLVMDSRLYPRTHYLRRVPSATVHKFTLLQLVCLGVLWTVKASPPLIAILFPLVLVLLVPVRLLANRFFQRDHLTALDVGAEPEEEQTHWN